MRLKTELFWGIKSFLFNVYHSAAVFALDLQIVACLRDAAAVGALNGVQTEVVGTIVERNDFVFLDGVVCQILLVDAHAHCVYTSFGCIERWFAISVASLKPSRFIASMMRAYFFLGA